jgi:hypothetical protein
MSPGIIEIVLLQYARNVCLCAKNAVQEINVNNAFQDSSWLMDFALKNAPIQLMQSRYLMPL